MDFGVDGARNLFTLSKKDRSRTKTKQNFRISGIVLLKEDSLKKQWSLHKIIGTNPDNQGIVRSVTLLLGIDDNSDCEQILELSISNLVLILEANYIDSQRGSLTWYQDDESLEGSQLQNMLSTEWFSETGPLMHLSNHIFQSQ